MTTINKYRVRCVTDSKDEFVWNTIQPTKCPTNTSHTISTITIVDKLVQDQVALKEEDIVTGGHYQARTLVVEAIKNTTTSGNMTFPYDTSAICVKYVTTDIHEGDIINLSVNKNVIIGVLTSNASPVSTWVSQNYTNGQSIIYNSKPYTCVLNTITNEIPTNKTYWCKGVLLNVNSTVVQNTATGFFIKLDDGTNLDDVGRVLNVDIENNKIYVEFNLTHSFLASTPTYIKNTVYMIRDFTLGPPSRMELGASKMGSSALLEDYVVTLDYENKSATNDKKFIGIVELLY